MGASSNVYVVAGVRVSDVLVVQTRKKKEPRFDPKTGERYALESDEYVPVLFGRDRPGLEPNPEEWAFDKELVGALTVFDTGIDANLDGPQRKGLTNPYLGYDYAKHFLGVQLNGAPPREYETPQVFELRPSSPEVTAALKTAHAELRKLGFTSEPKLYVIKYFSY